MLIINADDWGRSAAETDAALACWRAGRLSSVSAMTFMADSVRAAALAKEEGLDVGLHLNLSQAYSCPGTDEGDNSAHARVVRFLTRSKYAVLLYNPFLRQSFRRVFTSQWNEFLRLYGRRPSHIDGHQHMHLCANVILGAVLPAGVKVRRNFTFRRGEKGPVNRAYRATLDQALARKHKLTDFFFSLETSLEQNKIARVFDAARASSVEMMTHPIYPGEYSWLMGADHLAYLAQVEMRGYADF